MLRKIELHGSQIQRILVVVPGVLSNTIVPPTYGEGEQRRVVAIVAACFEFDECQDSGARDAHSIFKLTRCASCA